MTAEQFHDLALFGLFESWLLLAFILWEIIGWRQEWNEAVKRQGL